MKLISCHLIWLDFKQPIGEYISQIGRNKNQNQIEGVKKVYSFSVNGQFDILQVQLKKTFT